MYSEAVQEKMVEWIDEIEDFAAAREFHLTETTELMLRPSDDLSFCRYYLVDHASRVQMWFDEVTTDVLGIRSAVSEAHLRYAFEELYWSHVEQFPAHEAAGFNLLLDDLLDVLLHGRADHLSSPTSTIPLSPAECAGYIEILNTSRECGRLHSKHTRWLVGRVWAMISNHRFMTHHAQDQCRLSRDQSILAIEGPSERRIFSMFSAISYGTAQKYRESLERLWVDEIVYMMDWRPFIASCQQDWTASVSVSFALLLCNLVSFLAPFTILPFTMLSILLCNAAILSGVALLMKHQGAEAMSAGDAAFYLTSAQKSDTGFEHKAIVLSLPRTLLLWALGIFSAQAAAGFVLWMCMQRYGFIFISALLVPAVGCLAVKAIRSLWRRWSRSRSMSSADQSEV